jgi:hypothetical protein
VRKVPGSNLGLAPYENSMLRKSEKHRISVGEPDPVDPKLNGKITGNIRKKLKLIIFTSKISDKFFSVATRSTKMVI